VALVCGAGVAGIEGHGRVERVRLTDGTVLEADLVLAAIGSAPAVDWLASSGLDVARGVRCDSGCAVEGAPGVVAAGDVASWLNPLYGRTMSVEHWTHAIQQGSFAARRLLGCADPEGFASAPYFWSDQFDFKLESFGSTAGHDEARIVDHDGDGVIVAYGRAGLLVAVAGLNAGRRLHAYRRLVERRATIDDAQIPGGERCSIGA
jgi:NADPH-dependent 2,4-dienoyl-CoA reductase/sulfur reductase-like enzyme